MEFYQEGPVLGNTFESDVQLKNLVEKTFPTKERAGVVEQLRRVGEKAATTWLKAQDLAEKQLPVHKPFDPWGRRIDLIELSEGWKFMEREAATEGIVATAFERKLGSRSRVHQLILLHLFHPSSAFVSCPLAMTDGAARVLELFGPADLKSTSFQNLTTRNPEHFWTSGQWMTERTGGSDVSGTSTVASSIGKDLYELNGTKWFTSATTSQMSLLLGKTAAGLTLFYLERSRPDGSLNGIEVLRLKDKLGTRPLPTAELRLNKAVARRIGEEGEGVRKIASVLNITRLYNSVCASGHSRRVLDLAWDYSRKRKAFGQYLVDLPLHKRMLGILESEHNKIFYFAFFVAQLLGKEECGEASDLEKTWLRMLTPLVKLYTAKRVQALTSEVMEMFGGAGFVEDTGMPKWYRDAQIFSIWEGTTNVLSLDFLRCLQKEDVVGALEGLMKQLGLSKSSKWTPVWEKLRGKIASKDNAVLSVEIRDICLELSDMIAELLSESSRVIGG